MGLRTKFRLNRKINKDNATLTFKKYLYNFFVQLCYKLNIPYEDLVTLQQTKTEHKQPTGVFQMCKMTKKTRSKME